MTSDHCPRVYSGKQKCNQVIHEDPFYLPQSSVIILPRLSQCMYENSVLILSSPRYITSAHIEDSTSLTGRGAAQAVLEGGVGATAGSSMCDIFCSECGKRKHKGLETMSASH